jgi:hypothetical protein
VIEETRDEGRRQQETRDNKRRKTRRRNGTLPKKSPASQDGKEASRSLDNLNMNLGCASELLFDKDDLIVLEEIAGEVTGQRWPRRPRTFNEVTLRLVEAKGVLTDRLHARGGDTASALSQVRLVAAVLKDSEIVTTTSLSGPLDCQPAPGDAAQASVVFGADWKHQAKDTMSLDHHPSDTSPLEVIIALVDATQVQNDPEYVLACPIGSTSLRLSQEGNGGSHQLFVQGRPSPRHYVIFPSSNEAKLEEKKSDEPVVAEGKKAPEPVTELPYFSLDKASLCLQISWKTKELDVEICYGDTIEDSAPTAGNTNNNAQQLIVDDRYRDYSPVRVRRREGPIDVTHTATHQSQASLATVHKDESPISVVVKDLDSLARQQESSALSYVKASERYDSRNLQVSVSQGSSDSMCMEDVRRALDDDLRQQQDDSNQPLLSTSSTFSDSGAPISRRTISETTLASKSAVPKAKRPWSQTVRKPRALLSPRSKDAELSESSSPRKTDLSVGETGKGMQTDQSIPVSGKQSRRFFAGRRSKSGDRTAPRKPSISAEATPLRSNITNQPALEDQEKMDALADSDGEEEQAEEYNEIRDQEHPGEENSVVSTSDWTKGSERPADKNSTSIGSCQIMLGGAPPALCTSLSDVTMGTVPSRRERYLEDTMSRFSADADDMTAVSMLDDAMLQKAYRTCGGHHLDSVADAIFRYSPRMIRNCLDGGYVSSGDSVYSAETSPSFLSMSNVDFAQARTAATAEVTRQLSPIPEEGSAKDLGKETDQVIISKASF